MSHPDDLQARYYALAWQGNQLVGSYKGLQGLIDFVFQLEVSEARKDAFLELRERANAALGRQISALDFCEKQKKKRKWTPRQLESEALELLRETQVDYTRPVTQSIYELDYEASEDDSEYDKIADFIDETLDIDPTPIVLLHWIGYIKAGYEALCYAYEAYLIALRDFNANYRWDSFHITKRDWKVHYLDLVYGNKRGSTEYSVAMRATFQGFCFNAFQNHGLDEPITIVDGEKITMRLFFQQSQYVECFGHLKEYPKPEFAPLLDRWRAIFGVTKNLVVPPALQAMIQDVVQRKPLELVPSRMTSFNVPFQIMTQYNWSSGELNGYIQLSPCHDFILSGTDTANSTTVIVGDQGVGKTTIESAIVYLGTVQDQVTFIVPLSDSLNWPELAFIPAMGPPDTKKNPAFEFLTEKIQVKPRGIPVLILNIVESLEELEDVRMTKYDRILRVKDHTHFKVDYDLLYSELGKIANDMGFKKTCGIIAVRNLNRISGTERRKLEESDIDDAYNMLHNLARWYPKHLDVPIGIVTDETGRSGANQPKSSGQSMLGSAHELFIREGRRQDLRIVYAADSIEDVPSKVRSRAQNKLFGALPQHAEKSRDQLEIMLGSLPLDEGMREVAKKHITEGNLISDNHLVFRWDKRLPKNLDLLMTLPPPFQSPIRHVNNVDIKKAYAKKYGIADLFLDIKDVPTWKAEGDNEVETEEDLISV